MGKNKMGTVVHDREVNVNNVQTDTLTTKIPLDCIGEEGLKALAYWYVEDFDYAYIDWEKDEVVLTYKAYHVLPEGYVSEVVG